MFQKNDEALLAVTQKMQSLMQKTNVMKEWLESKKTEFEESPSLLVFNLSVLVDGLSFEK